MNIIVLIPVYKEIPDKDESLSLEQCFKILGEKYDTRLCCPTTLNTSAYNEIVGHEIKAERFAPHFFEGIEGYNDLMTSTSFYRHFKKFDYMLIYQLDAWVFSDQLEYWCSKGYDYIGAPWFGKCGTYENGDELSTCGNGGFSLRKIRTFIKFTSSGTRLMPIGKVLRTRFKSLKELYKDICFLLFNNNLKWFRRKKSYYWEDIYFCFILDENGHKLHRPSPREAAQFSFECSPSYLYELTGNTLPFGCHAYKKNQYETFWKNHIPGIEQKEE
ncbi:MAG: hypothetical protein IJZ22_04705 [Bacteroidaceae bacterium]|nr:hypothetical protein [Bacteroidaceae bacterium]